MDSLFSILAGKNFDEPPEAVSIKKFVQDNYQVDITVLVREKDISIVVPNAGLAGSLRMRLPELKRRCQIDKRILIRIA